MARNDRLSRIKSKPITPVTGMREYLGDSSFLMTVLVMLVFVLLHQRVISSELEHGTGGIWCLLGIPAGMCMLVSAAIAYVGAKTRLLPAIAPILGLGGMAAALVMFFVIIISRMRMAGGMLGVVQEVSMLAFLGAWIVCILLLMLTGIGMKVAPGAGVAASIATITALILFVVRAMYIFSSLITALSRNLLLPDGEMADNIRWVLRSVAPGSDAARSIYFDRLLDCVGVALLMMCCIPLAIRFNALFSEQAVNMKNAREIPRPTDYHRVYTGYDEYTEDVPVSSEQPAEDNFTITSDGYYVEKKVTDRAKFKRRDRTVNTDRSVNSFHDEQTQVEKNEKSDGEVFDDYVPGQGWDRFMRSVNPVEVPEEPQPQISSEPIQPKRVKPVRTDRPAIDPRTEDLWNQYTE